MSNEGFGDVGKVGNHVGDVTGGDVVFGGGEKDLAELGFSSTTGRGRVKKQETPLSLCSKGVPIRLFEVSEGKVRGFREARGVGASQKD